MAPYWFFLWMMFISISQQRRNQRRRQMGPRIRITHTEFIKLAEQELCTVVRGPLALWTGRTYVLRSGDYYFFTITKEPLQFPNECKIFDARQVWL
jgi:hypothetical protein